MPDTNEMIKARAEAIAPQDVEMPTAPVAETLIDAHSLLAYLRHNAEARKELLHVGLAKTRLDEFKEAITLLEDAEHAWRAQTRTRQTDDLKRALSDAYELRREALAVASFHTRDDRQAEEVLDRVREGEGHADLLADLETLALFIQEHADRFKRDKTFDPAETIEQLKQGREELREELAEDRSDESHERALDERNRAFMVLDEILDDLRDHGRFAFRHDRQRRAYFVNAYERRKRRRTRRQRADASSSPQRQPESPVHNPDT